MTTFTGTRCPFHKFAASLEARRVSEGAPCRGLLLFGWACKSPPGIPSLTHRASRLAGAPRTKDPSRQENLDAAPVRNTLSDGRQAGKAREISLFLWEKSACQPRKSGRRLAGRRKSQLLFSMLRKYPPMETKSLDSARNCWSVLPLLLSALPCRGYTSWRVQRLRKRPCFLQLPSILICAID